MGDNKIYIRIIKSIISVTIIFSILVSCEKHNIIQYQNNIGEFSAQYLDLKEEIPEIEQTHTLCYKDNNNKNIVINFSYPIQNTTREKLDLEFSENNGWTKHIFQNYVYKHSSYESTWLYPNNLKNGICGVSENGKLIKIIPEKVSEYGLVGIDEDSKSFFEREKLIYSDNKNQMNFYNTLSGFVCEIDIQNINEAPVWGICSEDFFPNNMNEFYLPFYDKNSNENDIKFLFQSLGILDAKNTFYEYKISFKKDAVIVNTEGLENICYPAKIYMSFECYTSKAIIDSQTNTASGNCYLKNYVILGDHPLYGKSEINIRFSTSFLPEIKRKKIKGAWLRIKSFNSVGSKIKAYYLDSDWCSWTIDEKNKPPLGNFASESILGEDGYYYIDITNLYKKNLGVNEEKLTEQGIRLKLEDDYLVLPTADNSIFPISVVVKY